MKYVIIIPDGMADRAVPELGGKTPMMVAKKPNMDYLAKHGIVGSVKTIPDGMPPGSDVANMAVLGYNPRECYTGRGPLEAASVGVDLDRNDVAFRCNLVTSDGTTMIDYSGGHVTSDEARVLMTEVDRKLHTNLIRFYPGVSYRHLLVWRDGSPDVKCTPPHDITGKPLQTYLPDGDGEDTLHRLIFDSIEVLDNHDINKRRRDEGREPANMIWPWGQGKTPTMTPIPVKFGVTGSMISAVDLLKGIAVYAGLTNINVPGATGYIDTNYSGKAMYALESLKERDLVVIHIEAPDEASHEGLLNEKIEAIEAIDSKVVGPILEGLRKIDQPSRIMILPDHRTPLDIKTHSSEPVPFLLYSIDEPTGTQSLPYDERAVDEAKIYVEDGYTLIERLFG